MTNTPALSTTSADEPRIRLDLSIAHAQSLAELIDLATRMHLGQFTEIAGVKRRSKGTPDRRRRGTPFRI